jgi:MTH538 TIR-like domain (DUF1863)
MKHTKKVFVSYDYDQDKGLKDLLIGQTHNPQCPFEVMDGSLKEAAREPGWEEKAVSRMQKADLVIVLVGAATHKAPGVLKEVRLARKLQKKVVQLIGHKDAHHPRVKEGGILYRWTWKNLEKILS